MNLFQLVIKQMRQRALGTWLTLFSVLLGVALAISIMILRREGQNLFAQTDFGYDILLGPSKGSPLQLTLNTVYHMDLSPGVIPYGLFEDMSRKTTPLPGHADFRQYVKQAVPFMVGDSYRGRRIVGTSPLMFSFDDAGNPAKTPWQYRENRSFEIAEGRVFAPRKFEAIIGSDVADKLHLHLCDPKLSPQENEKAGGAFRATHGMPGPNDKPDIHKPIWNVVGILAPTHTANDRVLFVPFISLYAIAEHEGGMIDQALLKANLDPTKIPRDRIDEVLQSLGIDPQKVPATVKRKFNMNAAAPTTAPADVNELMKDATVAPAPAKEDEGEDPDAYHLDESGNIVPDLPPDEWAISAILVQSRGAFAQARLMYNFKVIDDRAAACNPAEVMRGFFDTFLASGTMILLIISVLVTVVAAVGILVSIYNSVTARRKEIAILRALGATRKKVLVLICVEAALIGLFGGVLGLIAGHGLAAIGSVLLNSLMGQGINWLLVDKLELLYLVGVIVLATLAGLVPALSAYRTPVATNLVAG
jgi:putative ABC transport system permease protein